MGSHGRNFLLFAVLLSALVGPGFLTRLKATSDVTPSNRPGQIANSGWVFSNGGEFPGARGSVSVADWQNRPCTELCYDFTPDDAEQGPFDPHYVEASMPLTSIECANATEIDFAFHASSNRFRVLLRLEDASGQQLQYAVNALHPLTAFDSSAWMNAAVHLDHAESWWSGANDGRLHPPLKSLALVLDATGLRDHGCIHFSDIRFVPPASCPGVTALEIGNFLPVPPGQPDLAAIAGVNIHFTHDDHALDLVKAAGMSWVRMDATWNSVEKTPGTYDFREFDRLVDAAESRGLRVLAILAYGNAFHTGDPMRPPVTPNAIAAYASFCEAAARHYAGRKIAFEIWNEPDVAGFWGGSPSSAEFAQVLRAGIGAVKRGNPKALVLPGGLSTPYDKTYKYWDDLSKVDAFAGADGWTTHLYTDGIPEERWTDILLLKDRIATSIPGAGLWCTEWGFSSAKLSSSIPRDGHSVAARELQAGLVTRELLVAWLARLPMAIVYDLRDDGDDPANAEHNFGLLARDFTEKPAMTAVRTLISFSKGRRIAGLAQVGEASEEIHALRLAGDLDQIYVVWSEKSLLPRSLRVPQHFVEAWDAYGQHIAMARDELPLPAGRQPIYLRILNASKTKP